MKTSELTANIGNHVHYQRRRTNRAGLRAAVIAVNVSSDAYRNAVSFDRTYRDPSIHLLTGDERREAAEALRTQRRAEFLTSIGITDPDKYEVRVEDDHDKCVALLSLRPDGTPVGTGAPSDPEADRKFVIILARPTWVRELWADVEARNAAWERVNAEQQARLARQRELDRRRGELALPAWEPIITTLREAGADSLADSLVRDITAQGRPTWSGWTLDIDVILRLAGHTLPEVPEVSDAEVAA